MKPNKDFSHLPKPFWAAVRSISQHCGYTEKKDPKQKKVKGVKAETIVKVPSKDAMRRAYKALNLTVSTLDNVIAEEKPLIDKLSDYFTYRAKVLNDEVESHLMDASQAEEKFNELKKDLGVNCALPMNKQSDEKKKPAYLTGIVNMIIAANCGDCPVDFDPRELTTVTHNGAPLRTLSRRVDGALPSPVNPIAIWEIKEYYHTTTFGSRVADGVYESLLDGMELEELETFEKIKVLHYLFIDAKYTWWVCGKSYLCRIVDMVNMGYVDEALVGTEVLHRLPDLVKELALLYKQRNTSTSTNHLPPESETPASDLHGQAVQTPPNLL